MRAGALGAQLLLARGRAAPPPALMALPGSAAADEAHEPPPLRELRRCPRAGGGKSDRAARVAGNGGPQLGVRARRALDLAARRRLRGGARGVARRRAGPREGGRAHDPVDRKRRAGGRWTALSPRRAPGPPAPGPPERPAPAPPSSHRAP